MMQIRPVFQMTERCFVWTKTGFMSEIKRALFSNFGRALNFPGFRGYQPSQHPQQSGLSGTIWADKRYKITGCDINGKSAKEQIVTSRTGQTDYF